MISDRLYHIVYYVCKIGCAFGSFAIRFDRNTRTLLRCTKPNVTKKILFTTFLTRVVAACSIVFTAQSFLYGDINQFVLKLLFTVCEIILLIILSLPVKHVDDIMILINLALGLLQDTQGNSKKYININL